MPYGLFLTMNLPCISTDKELIFVHSGLVLSIFPDHSWNVIIDIKIFRFSFIFIYKVFCDLQIFPNNEMSVRIFLIYSAKPLMLSKKRKNLKFAMKFIRTHQTIDFALALAQCIKHLCEDGKTVLSFPCLKKTQ